MKHNYARTLILVIVLILVFSSISTCFATSQFMKDVGGASSSGDVTTELGTATDNLIKSARQIAIFIAGIMIILIGFGMFFGSSSQNIAKYKVYSAVFLLAMFLVFKTETIVGFLLKIFGVTL